MIKRFINHKWASGLMTALLVIFSAQTVRAASIIGVGTPIPASEILSYGGLEWVYAGPIGAEEWGVGYIHPPSYRASEGWRFATLTEWASRPAWQDFIKPGYGPGDVPAWNGWSDHAKYRFTSEYWSTFTHVDLGDADMGNIASGPVGYAGGVPETWYVRDPHGVPEAGATIALCGMAFLGLAGMYPRRK